ncbi:MAG: hypothetical protein WC406_06410 [Methanoregula sp.]
MTREDVENIALTKKGVEDLTEEVKEIKAMLKNQYSKCMTHFSEQDEEIEKIRDCACAEKTATTAIQTWKEAIFNKTTAFIVFIIACIDAAIRFIPWGR